MVLSRCAHRHVVVFSCSLYRDSVLTPYVLHAPDFGDCLNKLAGCIYFVTSHDSMLLTCRREFWHVQTKLRSHATVGSPQTVQNNCSPVPRHHSPQQLRTKSRLHGTPEAAGLREPSLGRLFVQYLRKNRMCRDTSNSHALHGSTHRRHSTTARRGLWKLHSP